MMKTSLPVPILYCVFCRKPQEAVPILVIAYGISLCSDCIINAYKDIKNRKPIRKISKRKLKEQQ